ncbi:AraC family transcriptional regulator [Opitutaceae bacterium EW11]|nr:AraC family transcriptional regulator [Opitutaceae bacterium EW11]
MGQNFRVSSLIRTRLEELSIPTEALLRQAGLPLGLFEQPKIFVTTDELFAFYTAIETLAPRPWIGLELGSEQRVERYDPIAIAALYTSSFRDAVERASRYKRLTCPEDIKIVERPGECAVRFEWTLAADRDEPRVLTDLCLAWVLNIARRGIGTTLTPVRVEFRRPATDLAVYERHFGCKVKFKSSQNALVFRAADFDRPFMTHNPELLALIAQQLESELAFQRAQEEPRTQVKTLVKRLLAGRRPDIADVARELGQSVRTLQRRLAGSGVTYQNVLEEARRELARHYLVNSQLELNETAYLPGFEDANSFFRAFTRWEGVSPGRWRKSAMQGR